eukprot:403368498
MQQENQNLSSEDDDDLERQNRNDIRQQPQNRLGQNRSQEYQVSAPPQVIRNYDYEVDQNLNNSGYVVGQPVSDQMYQGGGAGEICQGQVSVNDDIQYPNIVAPPPEVNLESSEVYDRSISRQQYPPLADRDNVDELIAQQQQVVDQSRAQQQHHEEQLVEYQERQRRRLAEQRNVRHVIVSDNRNHVRNVQANSWGRPQENRSIIILNQGLAGGGVYCQHCHYRGPPSVRRVISWYQVLIGIVLIVFFPFFCFIPFMFDQCYEFKTYCSNCNKRVKLQNAQ